MLQKKRMLLHTAQYMMRKWTEMARREAERRLYNKNPEYLGTSPSSGSGQLDQDLGTCLACRKMSQDDGREKDVGEVFSQISAGDK